MLQIIDVRSEGKKKIILLPPEEEKRNETKFIYKDEFDPLSIIQPFRLEKLPKRSPEEEDWNGCKKMQAPPISMFKIHISERDPNNLFFSCSSLFDD